MQMIEKYPAAFQHHDYEDDKISLHIESKNQCRSSILSKCIELYPESLDDTAVNIIMKRSIRTISISMLLSYQSSLLLVQ
jgi:hypothetical protein